MRTAYYDVRPVAGDGWILRVRSNGRVVDRSVDGEGKPSFLGRCEEHCRRATSDGRHVVLYVFDAGMLSYERRDFAPPPTAAVSSSFRS